MLLTVALLLISSLQLCFTQAIRNNHNDSLQKVNRSIQKCCPVHQYYDAGEELCVQSKYNKSLDFSDLLVYNNDMSEAKKSAKDSFIIIESEGFIEKCLDQDILRVKPRLTESGILYLEAPNSYPRWNPVPVNKYCLEYIASASSQPDVKPVPYFWIAIDEDQESPLTNPNKEFYETGCLVISCFFLMLVLIVYSSLKYLQNINGMILMAYTTSLLIAFLLLATMKISELPTATYCIGLTSMIYYFLLSSFCWMNVMSYDIWKTFRGYVNARRASSNGQKMKFQIYCAYAWGVPLLMTIGLIVLNQVDMSQVPWFVTPKISYEKCLIRGYEKLFYLYVPMLVLILCNWVFYLMTAHNLWRLTRDTSVLGIHYIGNKAARNSNKKRFLVYIYLSVVMGLNWIFEIVSFFAPELPVWYITDAFNALIGPMIFFIFICKKKIFKKIKATYSSSIKGEKSPKHISEKKHSNATQELLTDSDVIMQVTKQI